MPRNGLVALGVAICLGLIACKKKEASSPAAESPPAPEAEAAQPAPAGAAPAAPGATTDAVQADPAMKTPAEIAPQAMGGLEDATGTKRVEVKAATVTMTAVTLAVRKFKGKNGKLPASVEELISAGLIAAGPQVPKGFKVIIVDSAGGGEAKLAKQ
jgi:hypothetical protein